MTYSYPVPAPAPAGTPGAALPQIRFRNATFTASEGTKFATLIVDLDIPAAQPSYCYFTVARETAVDVEEQAQPNVDYVQLRRGNTIKPGDTSRLPYGLLEFPVGANTLTFEVPLRDDTLPEQTERLRGRLINPPQGETRTLRIDTTFGTCGIIITDDDTPAPSP